MGKSKNKQAYHNEGWYQFTNEDMHGSQMHESNGMEETNGGENTDKQRDLHSGHVSREDIDELNFRLLPYTSTVFETTQAIAEVQKQFDKLNKLYVKHASDIEKVSDVHIKLFQSRNECVQKSNKIREQKNTIAGLRAMSQEERDELEDIRERLKKDEKDLKKRMEEQESRATKAAESIDTAKARMEIQMKKDLDSLLHEQELEHMTRKKQLEEEMSGREVQRKRKLSSLEEEKMKLSEALKQKEDRTKILEEQVKLVNDEVDNNKAAMTTYKRQKEDLQRTLEDVQNEFGLTSQGLDFYKRKFADIAKVVDDISFRHFKALPSEDVGDIHDELKKIDKCFTLVPISEEETSEKLRVAHVQRIISSVLYHKIWRPFSCDKASQNPESATLLDEICTRLQKNDLGGKNGRAAIVWKVLTMRALQSLDQEVPVSPKSTSNEASKFSSRTNQAVQDILENLWPLVDLTEKVQLEEDLLRLTQSVVDVWNKAQTDDLKIAARISLNPSARNSWRSFKFDPDSSSDGASVETDIKSSTRPRIFTLFPQIVIQHLSVVAEPLPHIPGSFSTPQKDFAAADTTIHSGIGLPESSPLVLRGKHEQEQNDKLLSALIEKQEKERKEALSGRRKSRIGSQSGSISGSVSGSLSVSTLRPDSPSAQWGKGVSMMAMQIED